MKRPQFRIRDKLFPYLWLTWDLAFTFDEALKKTIEGCQHSPGRAFKIERIIK